MAERKFLQLEDISAYGKSFKLSNKVWEIVIKWDYFAKDTVGKQLVRAIDSISANIAEGFGRRHKKDKIKFYFNARGSAYEALDWLHKAKVRKLIGQEEYEQIFKVLSELPKEINNLIKFTEERMGK